MQCSQKQEQDSELGHVLALQCHALPCQLCLGSRLTCLDLGLA